MSHCVLNFSLGLLEHYAPTVQRLRSIAIEHTGSHSQEPTLLEHTQAHCRTNLTLEHTQVATVKEPTLPYNTHKLSSQRPNLTLLTHRGPYSQRTNLTLEHTQAPSAREHNLTLEHTQVLTVREPTLP